MDDKTINITSNWSFHDSLTITIVSTFLMQLVDFVVLPIYAKTRNLLEMNLGNFHFASVSYNEFNPFFAVIFSWSCNSWNCV